MFANCNNSKNQGDLGLGSAIAYFTEKGYTVSIPLTDSQDYDLIVDIGGNFCTIQVKTTSALKSSGAYKVELRTLGGNQSWNGVYKFLDKSKIKYIYILCSNGDRYLVPTNILNDKPNAIFVGGKKYNEYKI